MHTQEYKQIRARAARIDKVKNLPEFALKARGSSVNCFLFKNPDQIPVLDDEGIDNQDVDKDKPIKNDNLKTPLTDHYDYIFTVQPGKTNGELAVHEINTMLLNLKAFYRQENFAQER